MHRTAIVSPALRVLASIAKRTVPAFSFSRTATSTRTAANHGTRTSVLGAAMLAAALTGAAAISTSAAVAQAPVGLARVGPIDPVTGYPLWYEDTNGLKLGLCTDPNRCFFVLPDPAQPMSFPGNFPDESFYFAADASMAPGANNGLLVMALEAAFAQGPVAVGDNAVFARIRVRFTGLVDGATYTITHPYGVETLVAGVDGPTPGTINMTRDIGLAPLEFTGALRGDVGPFLTPVGFVNGGPGTFISDGATETLVQGSPRGTNFFRIAGPGAGTAFPGNALSPDVAQVNTFVMQGQVTRIIGLEIQKAFYSRTAAQTSVNVWAKAAHGVSMSATAGASLPVSMAEVGNTGMFFARIELGAGAPRPTLLSVTNQTDLPPTTITTTEIPDLVKIKDAVFTTGGDLVVEAVSSDKISPLAVVVEGDGFAPVSLLPGVPGTASGALGLTLGNAPPLTLRATSVVGGKANDFVDVAGVGTPIGGGGGPTAAVANAGGDITVPSNTVVVLSGAASTGTIDTFSWSHNAGALITLLGSGTATPVFTAPTVVAPLSIVFTLTVANALGSSQDTVVVNVTPIPQPPTETLTFTDARFIASKAFWRVDGTSSRTVAHTVTVYIGAVGNTSRPIGTAAVNALGVWSFRGTNGSATGDQLPLATDTQVWARSSLGGDSAAFVFRRG